MKRTFVCLVLALCGVLCHGQNGQRIIPVDSDIYRIVRNLYIEQRLALPSQSKPRSEDELRQHLDRIDPSSLSAGGRRSYEYVLEKAHGRRLYQEEGMFSFNGGLEANLEI